MALKVEKIKRVFKHSKLELEDPNENLSKEEVLDFYSTQYPELTNAHVSGPKVENDKLVFEFLTSVGVKG